MSEEVKHTPVPWTTAGFYTYFAPNGLAIGHCRIDHFGQEESKANASFIVRAVNSHDALVEALERVRNDDYAAHGTVSRNTIAKVNAALAIAKGEPK